MSINQEIIDALRSKGIQSNIPLDLKTESKGKGKNKKVKFILNINNKDRFENTTKELLLESINEHDDLSWMLKEKKGK